MRLNHRLRRARRLASLLPLALAAGCADELPTAGGTERFPGGVQPITIELLLSSESIVRQLDVFDGFSDPRTAAFMLVANDFDGELNAHTLARFRDLPRAVTYTTNGTSVTDSVFEYVSGELQMVVNASVSVEAPTTLQAWALEQAWDSATVSWHLASNGTDPVPWTQPGGSRGALLGTRLWTPGDTVAADTVIVELDSAAIRTIVQDEFPGIVVTSQEADRRVQLSSLSLRARVRPATTPDTTIAISISTGARTFVYDPPPPDAPGVLRVGGLTGARTVLQLDLSQTVPACEDIGSPVCPQVELRDVTLNLAELVLEPLPVPAGYRPLGAPGILARRVVEPDLGPLAPLGDAIIADTVSASAFAVEDADPVRLTITNAVRRVAEADSARFTMALLSQTVGTEFGYQWYAPSPRIRLVYTLPLRPTLP